MNKWNKNNIRTLLNWGKIRRSMADVARKPQLDDAGVKLELNPLNDVNDLPTIQKGDCSK